MGLALSRKSSEDKQMAGPPHSPGVEDAVRALRAGELVGLPTETVYGLGADASNELAVRRIFEVKGRPSSHPLIVHLADAAALDAWAVDLTAPARALAGAFWPGPLTLVVKRSALASDAVTGGQDTVALRVPAHPLALEVLRRFGGGVAAPSANRFGHVSPTTAAHVRADLGAAVACVLDGGPCAVGVESTIVDVTTASPVLLRPGGLATEDIERCLGGPLRSPDASSHRAPGMLAAHYAPRAGLLLVPEAELERVARERAERLRVGVLSRKALSLPPEVRVRRLSGDLAEEARSLYAALRELDEAGVELIVASVPPTLGLGRAVADRLQRAAHHTPQI